MKTMKFIFILLLYMLPAFAIAQSQTKFKERFDKGVKLYQKADILLKAGDKIAAYKERDNAKAQFNTALNFATTEDQKQKTKTWIEKCEKFPPKVSPINTDVSIANKWTISWDEENQCIQLKNGNRIECYRMVPVEGGTYNKENSTVTIMNFSIGETEVTEFLWNVVMKGGVSSRNLKPKTKFTWAECNQFMDKLIEKTGVAFRLPDANEWEYAASGGNKTNGYEYAGAGRDELDQITYIDGNLHPVKGKRKNELGLYDMTGNAYELTSTPHEFGGYILKGGSCAQTTKTHTNYKKLKITAQEHFIETDKQNNFGFRIVKSYE